MQIFEQTIDGKTIPMEVERSVSIGKLKQAIHTKSGIPIDQLRLNYRGNQLKDECILSDYNIENESTLHLSLKVNLQLDILKSRRQKLFIPLN